MDFLNKYIYAVRAYYGEGTKFGDAARGGKNLTVALEPTRMLFLLINENEGLNSNAINNTLELRRSRCIAYNDLKKANEMYDFDKHFRRRYNEIAASL